MRKSWLCILITFIVLLGSSKVIFAQQEEAPHEELRDPFISLIDSKGELRKDFQKPWAEDIATKISLMGISQINGIFYALIDGELVKEGDMLKELKVDKIETDRVLLSIGDRIFELKWKTEKK